MHCISQAILQVNLVYFLDDNPAEDPEVRHKDQDTRVLFLSGTIPIRLSYIWADFSTVIYVLKYYNIIICTDRFLHS